MKRNKPKRKELHAEIARLNKIINSKYIELHCDALKIDIKILKGEIFVLNHKLDTKKERVLLLTSYCADNPKCSDDLPCVFCLQMCNVFTVDSKRFSSSNNLGGFDYLLSKTCE